jgi:hypothetical protein
MVPHVSATLSTVSSRFALILSFITQVGKPIALRRNEITTLATPFVDGVRVNRTTLVSLSIYRDSRAFQVLALERQSCPVAFENRTIHPSLGTGDAPLNLSLRQFLIERLVEYAFTDKFGVSLVEPPFVLVGQLLPFGRKLLPFVCQALTFVCEPLAFVRDCVPRVGPNLVVEGFSQTHDGTTLCRRTPPRSSISMTRATDLVGFTNVRW